MIRKLLLTCSCIMLLTVSFSGKIYAAQEGELTIVSEELIKLNNLYKEGIITEEEFIKAKAILLNPTSDSKVYKTKKKKKKKKARTAAERERLEKQEQERLLAEKKAEKERKKAEKIRIREERELRKIACQNNPGSEACNVTIVDQLKGIGSFISKREREKREKNKELEK